MKKILLGLLALSAVSMAATGDSAVNARLGFDMGTKYGDYTSEGFTLLSDKGEGFGGEVAVEYLYEVMDNFSVGLGLAYQMHTDREDQTISEGHESMTIEGAEYDSIPLYLTAEYKFVTQSGFNPYLKANLGYSFNMNSSDVKWSWKEPGSEESGTLSTDIDNGLYWAVGGGIEYNNFTVDVMYAMNKGKTTLKDEDWSDKFDDDYGRVVLSLGYRFDL